MISIYLRLIIIIIYGQKYSMYRVRDLFVLRILSTYSKHHYQRK